jgi:endonuclease G
MKKIVLFLALLTSLYSYEFYGVSPASINKMKNIVNDYKKSESSASTQDEAASDDNVVYKKGKPDFYVKKIINESDCSQVLGNDVVLTCYDYKYKGATAVFYRIDGSLVNAKNIEAREEWRINQRIPDQYRGNASDYIRTGYDKGHLAPDSAFDFSQRILKNTYDVNINSVPMAAKVNRDTWIKAERYSKQTAASLGELNVMDIIEYPTKPDTIGHNDIAVPSGFYKIMWNDNSNFKKCFYYKNDKNVDVESDDLRDHIFDCKEIGR